jgi:hypothetical protein
MHGGLEMIRSDGEEHGMRTRKEVDDEFYALTKIDGPRGWIQWKGTQVCMDVHCVCGEHTHIDAEFAYYVRCGSCRQIYRMGGDVRLVPVSQDEFDASGAHPSCLVESD